MRKHVVAQDARAVPGSTRQSRPHVARIPQRCRNIHSVSRGKKTPPGQNKKDFFFKLHDVFTKYREHDVNRQKKAERTARPVGPSFQEFATYEASAYWSYQPNRFEKMCTNAARLNVFPTHILHGKPGDISQGRGPR
ncbi:hypothetical protein NDU88_005174 [Pleurodeles waltl]|uniref:Uncharacterized protein n=1 Tax=Pleurodeles waltl TaxID=8319 RepID=A0AAV7UHU0_PLEWA|nr:hypothetical protein NDU88_005174 [Pleurodeles waltl]